MKAAKAIDPIQPGAGTGAEPSRPVKPDPDRWVEQFGDHLFSYALARLRNRTQAEDFVQETFLAALRSQDQFQGRGAESSWLIGILRNKILDYYRTADRERPFTDLDLYAEQESGQFVDAGLRQGAWKDVSAPADWPLDAQRNLDQPEFWKAFRSCADKLPGNLGRAFVLREVDELDTKEICDLLGVTENNLWVMLHRARLALRRCLETTWFGKHDPS